MNFRKAALEADVAVEALDLAVREIRGSRRPRSIAGDIDAGVAARSAGLNADLATPERAAHDVDLAALVAEAVLHQDADRAAQCVQAERRVVADDRHGGDGVARDDVPVHRVAEGFVDAHAVLVDGEALRAPADRRRVEAAVGDFRAHRVAGGVGDDDARHLLLQRLLDRRRAFALDVGVGYVRHRARHRDRRRGRRPPRSTCLTGCCARWRAARRRTADTAERRYGDGLLLGASGLLNRRLLHDLDGGKFDGPARGGGWGGGRAPESCAMAGAAVRETRHNTHANADAKRITVTPPVVREVTDTTDFEPVRLLANCHRSRAFTR